MDSNIMTNRLPRQFFFLLLILSFFIINPLKAQNSVSIPEDTVTHCPYINIALPVMSGSIQNIDSISLVFNYQANTLSYLSFREVNQVLRTNGTYGVTQVDNNTVRFTWDANAGATATVDAGKLFELQFSTGTQSGDISFDAAASLFRDNTGASIPTEYSGTGILIRSPMSIIIEEIDPTCPGACEANIAGFVTGGVRPYHYTWNGEISPYDSVKTGACGGPLIIEVTDANGCTIDTLFQVTELTAAEAEMETDPDTVYIQNPIINFSFTDDPGIVDWWWDFGDGAPISREKNPKHLYTGASNEGIESYTAVLFYVNEDGCSDSTSIIIPVAEANLFIPNVFIPSSNMENNKYFKICKIDDTEQKVPIVDEYIRMELVVLNRWGRKVYENLDYQNNWDGDNLPEGTYYYRLNMYGYFRDDSYKGAVVILR